MNIGVAISTTGDEHRLGLLEACIEHWSLALSPSDTLVITVDGSNDDLACVANTVGSKGVYRVGQPVHHKGHDGPRVGVAANKNTGLELLMNSKGASEFPTIEHLFLSDDDFWPRSPEALLLHTRLISQGAFHSMVGWGAWRHPIVLSSHMADWSWPRGSMLYTHRSAVVKVGGMVEEFGPGGHEHVEWSRRIYNAGFTPAKSVTPAEYAGDQAMGAQHYWYGEDMPKPGETMMALRARRNAVTSLRRSDHYDQRYIDRLMARMAESTAFVPFRAVDNGRASATLYRSN